MSNTVSPLGKWTYVDKAYVDLDDLHDTKEQAIRDAVKEDETSFTLYQIIAGDKLTESVDEYIGDAVVEHVADYFDSNSEVGNREYDFKKTGPCKNFNKLVSDIRKAVHRYLKNNSLPITVLEAREEAQYEVDEKGRISRSDSLVSSSSTGTWSPVTSSASEPEEEQEESSKPSIFMPKPKAEPVSVWS